MKRKVTVILGTAHGSNVGGKCAPDKSIMEYKWSREMCQMIKAELEKRGVEVIIDIEGEVEPSLDKRIEIVNSICHQNGASNCIYVSVHINAAKNDGKWHDASGFTVWVAKQCSEASKRLALSLFEEAKKRNLFGNRYIPSTKFFTYDFKVLRKTLCPAILVENMFQDNKKDVEYLLSDGGKQELCAVHVDGIMRYIENE